MKRYLVGQIQFKCASFASGGVKKGPLLKKENMNNFNGLLLVIMLSLSVKASLLQQENGAKKYTKVVSNEFCYSSLPAEVKIEKKTLEEVHSYAELKHDSRASLPDSFTVCSTIMTTSCPNYAWPSFFTILDNDRAQYLSPNVRHGSMKSFFHNFYPEGSSDQLSAKIPPLFLKQWTTGCMAVNASSGLIQWVVDGTSVHTTICDELRNSKSRPRDLSKKLVLGAISYYGDVWLVPSNKVTNLNIFSSALPVEQMERMTKGGSCVGDGDYLAWADMEWILHGEARIETVNQEEPCKGDPYVDLYYSRFSSMDACMHHCQNLGTRVPSVTNSEDWLRLQSSLKTELYDKGRNTLRLWLPVDDQKTEGEWRDFYTGSVMQNYTPPWVGSGPDGGIGQNCAYLVDGNTWGDEDCNHQHFACMCTHDPSTHLEFKGLCPSSAIDVYYKPTSDFTDSRELRLQGLAKTSITYNNEEELWILDVIDSNVTGMSRAAHASFTLGKHNWTIKGDKGCNRGEPYVTELKMSGCQKGYFTCNDGQCVSMGQRCNQLPDCRDKSDEMNCQILILEDGYNMEVPPIVSNDPVEVRVSIDLLRLVDIDEEDYSIEIQFEITLVWKEKRATYRNLKNKDSMNTLAKKDVDTLWLPKVIYENTDQKQTTRVGTIWEWETRVSVRREEQKGSMSGSQSVDETEIFSGFENSLVMNQTYTHTFQCNYQLSRYPFDTQVN